MATDTDPYALGQSINMLNGRRWVGGLLNANKQYTMPADDWNTIKSDPEQIKEVLKYFITQHYQYQLPRILELERYYKGDNDIHFANTNISSSRATIVLLLAFQSSLLIPVLVILWVIL